MKFFTSPDRTRAVFIQIITALLIVLFVYAGISKYYERSLFEAQLSFYPYISGMAVPLSWLIPSANLFTAIVLMIPKINRPGLYVALAVLLCYTLYLIVMLATQDDLPCSCGGIIKSLSWTEQVTLNLLLIILTLAALVLERPYKSLQIHKQQLQ